MMSAPFPPLPPTAESLIRHRENELQALLNAEPETVLIRVPRRFVTH